MKKVILMALVGALPAIALAGCGGSEAQDTGGLDTADNSQATEQHSHEAGGHDEEATAEATEEQGHDSDGDEGHAAVESEHNSDGHSHEAAASATQEHSHDDQSSEDHEHGSPAGSAGNAADVSRTVKIGMNDTMRFTPDSVSVKAGETIRFSIHNNGKIPHEFVIGSMSELLEHAEMMKKMPGMQHAESNMVTLDADADGEIIWKFGEAGSVDFACLIPGHLEAGMKGAVAVE